MKFEKLCKVSLWCIVPLLAACAQVQLPPFSDGSLVEAEFPASWMGQMTFAYEDFRRSREDMSCFVIYSGQEDGIYFVAFIPQPEVEVQGDQLIFPVPGEGPCGYGASYEFSNSGEFIRRIGLR